MKRNKIPTVGDILCLKKIPEKLNLHHFSEPVCVVVGVELTLNDCKITVREYDETVKEILLTKAPLTFNTDSFIYEKVRKKGKINLEKVKFKHGFGRPI